MVRRADDKGEIEMNQLITENDGACAGSGGPVEVWWRAVEASGAGVEQEWRTVEARDPLRTRT